MQINKFIRTTVGADSQYCLDHRRGGPDMAYYSIWKPNSEPEGLVL